VFVLYTVALALPQTIYQRAVMPGRAQFKLVETLFAETGYASSYLADADLARDTPLIQVGYLQLFVRPDLYAYLLVRGSVRSILAFQHDRLVDAHFMVSPLAGILGTVPYLLGLVSAIRQLWQPRMLLVLLWFGGGVIGLSIIHSWVPRHAHLVAIIPALCILIGLGIAILVDTLIQNVRMRWGISLILAGLIAAHGLWLYYGYMPQVYQPQLLDQAMRLSIDLKPGQHIVYIGRDPGEREQATWLRASTPTTSDVWRPGLDEIMPNDGPALAIGQEYLIFYHQQQAALLFEYIGQFSANIAQPQIFYNLQGNEVGRMVVVKR
jgi:hypothetical protein